MYIEQKIMSRNEGHTAEAEGSQAFEQFCTPTLSTLRTDDHEKLVSRARNHLTQAEAVRIPTSICEVQAYIFEPETRPVANVLVVHGWTGEAAFMGAFGNFLCRRGYRAILMDLPAHGESQKHTVSLFECAIAVLEVAEALGPIQFALGHSIGAMTLLTAGEGHFPLQRSYPFEAYALVAMPDKFADVTGQFGAGIGLSTEAQRIFEARLEELAGRPITEFSGSNLLSNIDKPALLIHSYDDDDVPFSCAESMETAASKAQILRFDNMGHRAVLYAPPVVRAAVTFFGDCLAEE